ncbi:MAG: sugar nucleotide-binding protein [Opitutales bacterium]
MIFILGGSGYVGQAFCKLLENKGLAYRSISRSDINYADESTLRQWLIHEKPGFLINCAGYTGKPNVDACETDKARCMAGNAVLPGIIDLVCRELDISWGHVSSGCIFGGSQSDGSGFTEESVPNFSFRTNNCSFYSGTKALGEEALGYREIDGKWINPEGATCYIWRLRIPFDNLESPRNYLTKLMRYNMLLEATNSISELSEFVASCVECWENKLPYGIYNVTNPGQITTTQVVEIIKKVGLEHETQTGSNPFPTDYQFFDDLGEFMAKAAKTPRSNCVMDSSKLEAAGIQMTPVVEAIETALRNWIAEK